MSSNVRILDAKSALITRSVFAHLFTLPPLIKLTFREPGVGHERNGWHSKSCKLGWATPESPTERGLLYCNWIFMSDSAKTLSSEPFVSYVIWISDTSFAHSGPLAGFWGEGAIPEPFAVTLTSATLGRRRWWPSPGLIRLICWFSLVTSPVVVSPR